LGKPLISGTAYPLGAIYDGLGVNFALFSAHAEGVELCLYDERGQHESARHALASRTDGVWHCYLPQARPGLVYGYRVHGRYAPHEGHRFNPSKLLRDPYARAVVGDCRDDPRNEWRLRLDSAEDTAAGQSHWEHNSAARNVAVLYRDAAVAGIG
jgi:pullulanase/glycogen debranching enzyme